MRMAGKAQSHCITSSVSSRENPSRLRRTFQPLPDVSQWTSVRDLGATGDGGTDDTEALQHAIDSHRVLYFPMGLYRVRGTLHLKPDSILIGLSPATTVLVVNDDDPNFSGSGDRDPGD